MTSIKKTDIKDIEAINPDAVTMTTAVFFFPVRRFHVSFDACGWGRFWWTSDWYWSLINSSSTQCESVRLYLCIWNEVVQFFDEIDELMNESKCHSQNQRIFKELHTVFNVRMLFVQQLNFTCDAINQFQILTLMLIYF